jgi:hypothetical protein
MENINLLNRTPSFLFLFGKCLVAVCVTELWRPSGILGRDIANYAVGRMQLISDIISAIPGETEEIHELYH